MALDDTGPITPDLLTPVAAPIKDNIDTAEKPTQDSSLIDLATGLSKLDSGLSSFLDDRAKVQDDQDRVKGEIAFHTNNAEGYADAVSNGHVPAIASKAFMDGYKQTQGAVAGDDLIRKFDAAYDTWDGKTLNDGGAAYGQFVQGFLKDNISTTDPQVLLGLKPKIDMLAAHGQTKWIHDQDVMVKEGALNAAGATVNQTLDTAQAASLANPQGDAQPNPDDTWNTVMSARDKFVKMGLRPQDVDHKIVDAITSKAIEQRNPKLLDLLGRNVPGTNYSYADDPYGSAQKASTTNTLEAMGRKAIQDRATAQAAADTKALGDVKTRMIGSIIANPAQPIPEDLLKQGETYDPSFRITALKDQKTILESRGQSDPDAVTQLNHDIMNGGGLKAVQTAYENHVLTNPSDYREAWKLAKDYDDNADRVKTIMTTPSVTGVMSALNARTQNQLDLGQPFAPENISDQGLSLQYQMRIGILDWAKNHPNATLQDQETAVNSIGATLLKSITNTPGSAAVVSPTPGAAPTPFAVPALPQQPATIQGPQGAPVAPAQVAPATTTPPAATGSSQAAPVAPSPAVQAWFTSLKPEQQKVITDSATKLGQDPMMAATMLYTHGLGTGAIKPVPTPSPVAPSLSAPAAATPSADQPQDDLSKVLGDALDGKLPENRPVDADMLRRAGEAFASALDGTGATKGNYALATIKDDPKAARILDFVSGPESNGNYNAYFGHAGSTKDLSQMNLAQISNFMRTRGTESSATGRYQFMAKTLFGDGQNPGLMQRMGLKPTDKFTPELQDKMAVQLLKDRGYDAWRSGRMSTPTFANNLAKEWASLPNLSTGKSHYDGDGLNHALVTTHQVLATLNHP